MVRRAELAQLIYRSVAAWPLARLELKDLLEQAQARNQREGLTGLLVYQQGRFVQWLEGPPEPLQQVWQGIQRDARHLEVERLTTPHLHHRLFPDWRMLFSSDQGGHLFGQLELPEESLRELRNADANVAAVVQGLALWHQLPSPERMAQALASVDDEFADALTAHVVGLRPDWRAVGWHLLGPVARELGNSWQRDAISAAELGIASARLHRLLREVGAQHGASHAERSDRSVLVAPLPGETELTGVVYASVALDAAGWQVRCAFPRRMSELEQTLATEHHDVLHLALSDALRRENRLGDLAEAIRDARRVSRNTHLQVLVSGRAFAEQPGLAELLGADGDGLAQGGDSRDLEAMMNWARQRSNSPAAMVAQAALMGLSLKLQQHCVPAPGAAQAHASPRRQQARSKEHGAGESPGH